MEDMDFVEWCGFVLATCIKAGQTLGLQEFSLAEILSTELRIPNFRIQPDYDQSTYYKGMGSAIEALMESGLMGNQKGSLGSISKAGQDYVVDVMPVWLQICQERLDVEHERVLRVVNQLSQKRAADHAWLEMAAHDAIVSQLNETGISDRLQFVARELKEWGFVSGWLSAAGTVQLQSTFKGLVWETRRGFTLESQFIDDLVAEWETTSVDFKRELSLDTMDQKAEFVKDILSLVNTKASGRRWLIIGFDDRSRAYFGPPDSRIAQDRIEQLIARYIEPSVDVRYEVVDYRAGRVGKLEVVRDPKKLPYRVKEQMNRGNRKAPLMPGDLFVRHGSQVEKPTDAELLALQEEGDHARSAAS